MVSKKATSIIVSSIIILMLVTQFSLVNGSTLKSSELSHVINPKKVLFTRNNGYWSPSNALSKMAAYFISEGYAVDEVQTELTALDLVDVDILIVNSYQVTGNFNQSEKDLITSFLESGGSLIMFMVAGGLDFGVSFGSYIGVIGSHTLEYHSSDLTDNLPPLYINSSSGVFDVTLSGNGEAIVTTDAGSDLPNVPILATSTYGDGKVFACSVGTLWDDQYWDAGGNSILIEKSVQWFETKMKKVVFTRNAGYFSPSNAYSQMASFFESYDYRVEEIQTEINSSVLEYTSILFVNAYQVSVFNQSEITAIEEFVYAGGGLIISVSGGGLDFGVKLTTNMGVLNSYNLAPYNPHPITAQLPIPLIPISSAIRDIELNGTAQSLISTDAGSTHPNATIIATNVYGEGKIMVSTVGTLWDDTYWNDGGNDDLVEEYLKWFESEGVKNFVFANNNGYFSPTNAYLGLAFYVAKFGYQTYELIDEEPTVDLLETTDILLINSYQDLSSYSPESEAAIENWVANGGALIVVTRGISISFGLHVYNFGPTDGLYENDSFHIHYHPVSAGITDVTFTPYTSIAKFDVDDEATIVVSTTAHSNTPERPVIAVNHYGQGRVMGCSVGGIWDSNHGFDQNKGLIKNFIDWITVNTTTPHPWVSEHPDISYDEGTVGNQLSWTMSSYYPYYYQLYLDESVYQSGSWSSYPLTVNIDGLYAGSYSFSLYIFDHYGRVANDSVEVIVNGEIDPETTDTTDIINATETTELTTQVGSSPFSIMATLFGIILTSIFVGYKRHKRY